MISNDPMGSGVWPSYRIIVVPFKGAAREVDHPDFDNPDTTFEVTQTGNVIKFDLGYDNGFKKDAVLTSKGLMVLNKRVARPVYNRNECKWIYGQALGECLANISGDGSCVNMHRSMSTVRGLYHLEENPRWAVAKDRFELACKKACETKKRPHEVEFAKDICGP